jgi:DNA-binding SARP family transcriptional activator
VTRIRAFVALELDPAPTGAGGQVPAPAGDAGVAITLLGDVTVARGGAGGEPNRRVLTGAMARVTLAMLTLERHDGVRGEALADALWPRHRPPTWASALRNAVSRVRRDVAAVLDDDLLVAVGGTYRLRLPGGARIDVEVAERQILEARRAHDAGDAGAALAAATAAVDGLRGRFLDGHDGAWVEAGRARLAVLLTAGLEIRARAALAAGDPALAADVAREVIEREPLRESAHRLLMAAHAASGNRADALRAYQRLRRRLADELGVDPDVETEAAYVRLLGPDPEAAGAPGQGFPPWTPAQLVGRDRELAAGDEVWARATAGHPSVLLVIGEAGIGKSRLLAELAATMAGRGALVRFGRCDPDAAFPYQPLVEMFDTFAAGVGDEGLSGVSPAARAELARVLPSLSPWRPPAPPAGPGDPPDRALLHAALARLAAHAARDRPLLLVLDDAHLLDADTARLLRHLVRRAGGPRVMVAMAARAEVPADHVAATFRALEREGLLHRVALAGLDPAACELLVEAALPGEPAPGSLAEHLVADTSGNPAMVVELLRRRQAERAGAGAADARAGLGLDALVADRLAGLGDGTVALLRAAAVCGRRFELDVVVAAAGLTAAEGLDAVDAAVARGLLVEVGGDGGGPGAGAGTAPGGAGPAGHLRFAHEVVRRTLEAQLSRARRRRLHARVADAIERLRAGRLEEHRAALAHHRGAAAGPGDPRARRAALDAATAARRRGAPAEALRWCRQALDHLGAGGPGGEAAVLAELGAVQALLDDEAGDP